MSLSSRLAMVDRTNKRISLARRCELPGSSRSSIYHRPREMDAGTLQPMRLIDEQCLRAPFYGSRRMAVCLRRQGFAVGRDRVRRLMQLLGLEAIYQKPRTSAPHPEHRIHPYLLRELVIDRPNQVWCADVCYIPMKRQQALHPSPAGSAASRRRRGARFSLSHRHHGLVWPLRAQLAAVHYPACRLLRRCAGGCLGGPRQPRDLQHRPGQPIHR